MNERDLRISSIRDHHLRAGIEHKPDVFDTVYLLRELDTCRNDLATLIDAVYVWAGRPSKDGAKNLRALAYELGVKNGIEG